MVVHLKPFKACGVAKLPSSDFWQHQKFEFDQFEPRRLEQGENIQHLRMDAVLQFLLGDKL